MSIAGNPTGSSLSQDPHQELAPDFSLPNFADNRAHLTVRGMSDEDAAASLAALWIVEHQRRLELHWLT